MGSCPVCQQPLHRSVGSNPKNQLEQIPYFLRKTLQNYFRTFEEYQLSIEQDLDDDKRIDIANPVLLRYNYALESILRFMCAAVLAEYQHSGLLDRKIHSLIHGKLAQNILVSVWAELLQMVYKHLEAKGSTWEIPSLRTAIEKLLAPFSIHNPDSALQQMIALRNKIAHQLLPSWSETREFVEQSRGWVELWLECLSWTSEHPVVLSRPTSSLNLVEAAGQELVAIPAPPGKIYLRAHASLYLGLWPIMMPAPEIEQSPASTNHQLLLFKEQTNKYLHMLNLQREAIQDLNKSIWNEWVQSLNPKRQLRAADYDANRLQSTLHSLNQIVMQELAQENKISLCGSAGQLTQDTYQPRIAFEAQVDKWWSSAHDFLFVAAQAGSGKTNSLVHLAQHTDDAWTLLIRVQRSPAQISQYLCDLFELQSTDELRQMPWNHPDSKPLLLLLDGGNEHPNPQSFFAQLAEIFAGQPGRVKCVLSWRANSPIDLPKLPLNLEHFVWDAGQQTSMSKAPWMLENPLYTQSLWLAPLDEQELRGAWQLYFDQKGYQPLFDLDRVKASSPELYQEISTPLVLKLFMQHHHGQDSRDLAPKYDFWAHWWQQLKFEYAGKKNEILESIVDCLVSDPQASYPLDLDVYKQYSQERNRSPEFETMISQGWISCYRDRDDIHRLAISLDAVFHFVLSLWLEKQGQSVLAELSERPQKIFGPALGRLLRRQRSNAQEWSITALDQGENFGDESILSLKNTLQEDEQSLLKIFDPEIPRRFQALEKIQWLMLMENTLPATQRALRIKRRLAEARHLWLAHLANPSLDADDLSGIIYAMGQLRKTELDEALPSLQNWFAISSQALPQSILIQIRFLHNEFQMDSSWLSRYEHRFEVAEMGSDYQSSQFEKQMMLFQNACQNGDLAFYQMGMDLYKISGPKDQVRINETANSGLKIHIQGANSELKTQTFEINYAKNHEFPSFLMQLLRFLYIDGFLLQKSKTKTAIQRFKEYEQCVRQVQALTSEQLCLDESFFDNPPESVSSMVFGYYQEKMVALFQSLAK